MASKAGPGAGGLAAAAVDDQVLGPLGDLGVEVVHEHAQGGLLEPALAGQLCAAGGAAEKLRIGLGSHGGRSSEPNWPRRTARVSS